MLAHLHELATRVAIDVDEHSSRVEEINEELTSADDQQATVIIDIVARLVQANQDMQERLAATEGKLQDQARQLESHATESRTDALTLLANRRAFDSEMSRRLAEFRRQDRVFSLVMIDVDYFKRFNDTHGHQAGDEVLRVVGRTLRRRMREMDVVARYGGEEFAIILPGAPIDEARRATTRAREVIEKAHLHFDGKDLQVTASLGVAQVLSDEDASGLIKRADEALYASKDAGRNCGHWHDGKDVHPIDAGMKEDLQESKPQDVPNSQPPRRERYQGQTEESVAMECQPSTETLPSEGNSPAPSASEMGESLNLPTRLMFLQQVRSRIAEWKRGGSPVSVLLMEVDQYDEIMSHTRARVRDVAMQSVVRFATTAVREMDSVGRYNSGCIAILLPHAKLASAIEVAERLPALF